MIRRMAILFLTACAGLPMLALPTRWTVGTITDEAGHPIPWANVRYRATTTRTWSNADGVFRLPKSTAVARIAASSPGFVIGGSLLRRLPFDDCERYEWRTPTHCAECHTTIAEEWASSGHSRSSSSQRFRDAISSVLDHLPDGASVCASCHAPTAPQGLTEPFDPEDFTKLGSLSGVHCDFCHKVAGPGEGEYGRTHGRYQLRLHRPDPEAEPHQWFFGPLDDALRGDGVYSPFQRDSRLCAACHEGIVFGVHAYSTYSEWLASPARKRGQHCQHCHMAPTGMMTNLAPGHGGVERDPLTLGRHRMFWPDRETMMRDCLTLELRVRDADVVVTLTARGVGHRVPTGFPDRSLILRFLNGTNVEEVRFEKALVDRETGKGLVPYWLADPVFEDTRLNPEEPFVRSWKPIQGQVIVELWEERPPHPPRRLQTRSALVTP